MKTPRLALALFGTTLALAGAIALGILIGMGFPKLLVELGGHALEKLPLCHREARP